MSHGRRLRDWQAEHGDLVRAQVATPARQWNDRLRQAVASVTTADFVLGDADDACLDLVAVVTA
jgi:hypothetical protein